jgi:hypothetical protein
LLLILKLKDHCGITLHIPEIVYDECIGHYSERIDQEISSIKKSFEKLEKTALALRKNKVSLEKLIVGINRNKELYRRQLDRFIEDHKIVKVGYPELSHKQIVMNMYDRKAPFFKEQRELGYKDLLIIESLKQSSLEDDESHCVVFTRNIKDFSPEAGKEISDIYPSYECDRIKVVSDLNTLKNKIIEQYSSLHKSKDIFDHDELATSIGKYLTEDISCQQDIFGYMFFEPTITRLISTISGVKYEVSEDFNLLEITGFCTIDLRCDFEISRDEVEFMDSDFIFFDLINKYFLTNPDLDENSVIKFSDVGYCGEYNFEYLDFEYSSEKSVDSISEGTVFISKKTSNQHMDFTVITPVD